MPGSEKKDTKSKNRHKTGVLQRKISHFIQLAEKTKNNLLKNRVNRDAPNLCPD